MAPQSLDELSRLLAAAHAGGRRIGGCDLSAFSRVVEHTPEDMTVTVEAGVTLAALQAQLRERGQWLPVDPPNPEKLSIGALLDGNASGPRRFGYGAIREHLIGLQAVLADGAVIKSGGKVVKNVAGYDLMKVFVGSRGTLGVITSATFKVRPLPEAEIFASAPCDSLEVAGERIEATLNSPLTPVVLDLYNLAGNRMPFTLVVGFAGSREEADWQLGEARKLGFTEPATLEYDRSFRANSEPLHHRSVLPSRVCEALAELGGMPFVARAGNGVIYYRSGPVPPRPDLPVALLRRLKDTFDPKHILPELPW